MNYLFAFIWPQIIMNTLTNSSNGENKDMFLPSSKIGFKIAVGYSNGVVKMFYVNAFSFLQAITEILNRISMIDSEVVTIKCERD